jgi:hypothetical protein
LSLTTRFLVERHAHGTAVAFSLARLAPGRGLLAVVSPFHLRISLLRCVLVLCVSCSDDISTGTCVSQDETTRRAAWRLRSFDVDIDLDVETVATASACTTSARLSVNKLIGSTDVYKLDNTPCQFLELASACDLILKHSPTGVDWSAHPLRVNKEENSLHLGPATHAHQTYTFNIISPECKNHAGCRCHALPRDVTDGEELQMPLGRTCD